MENVASPRFNLTSVQYNRPLTRDRRISGDRPLFSIREAGGNFRQARESQLSTAGRVLFQHVLYQLGKTISQREEIVVAYMSPVGQDVYLQLRM